MTLSDQQHNKEVTKEWIESVQRLKNKPKKAAIKDLKKAIDAIINGRAFPASEDEEAETEGVGAPAPTVTTSTNPTNPRVLRTKQRRYPLCPPNCPACLCSCCGLPFWKNWDSVIYLHYYVFDYHATTTGNFCCSSVPSVQKTHCCHLFSENDPWRGKSGR